MGALKPFMFLFFKKGVRMKRVLLTGTLFLLGVGLFLYPHAANYFSEKNASVAIQEYSSKVEELNEEEIQKEWDKAVAYNENLAGNPVHDPFVAGSGMAMTDNYYEVLNPDGTNTMGYLSIPKIEAELPIYLGTSVEMLAKGVGHLEGSYMPVGGKGTHSVLTGHTGLTSARIFTDLVELKKGDMFYLRILNKTLAYQVDQIKVVRPEQTEDLRRVEEEDYCTLLTCTPYGVNSHRLLVRGVRTEYIPEKEKEQKQQSAAGKLSKEERLLILVTVVTTIVMLVIIIFVMIWVGRNRKTVNKHLKRKGKVRYWWDEKEL